MDSNPKLFVVSIGTAFTLYKQLLGDAAEGVVGMSSWNRKSSPSAGEFSEAFQKRFNKPADYWGGGVSWASLQILEQSVASVGLDRNLPVALSSEVDFISLC